MDSTDELTRLAEAEQQLKEQHAARKKDTRRALQKRARHYPEKGQDRPKPHQCSRPQAQDAAAHSDGQLHGTQHR